MFTFTPKKRVNTLVLTALASLATALSANAQLIAYEGFDYGDGVTLQNASGGDSFGWAGTWANRTGSTNVASSLSYTDLAGNTLLTDGGSVIVGGSTASAYQQRAVTLPTETGTYWMSYLAQWIGPADVNGFGDYTRQGNLGFFVNSSTNSSGVSQTGGSERLDIGRPNYSTYTGTPYDTWTAWNANGASGYSHTASAPYTTDTAYSLSSATFVLIRFDIDATTGTDAAYIWFNWTNLTIMPDISTADIVDTNEVDLSSLTTGVTGIRINANGSSGVYTNTTVQFDEIRIGYTFADVTPVPEPATMALIGISVTGTAFLIRRRKK